MAEYEFNWDCNKCWYKEVCSKFGTPECNRQCIRYSEMDYLMYLSNIPKARQAPYYLSPEQDDLDAFFYLKQIKDNIKGFVDNGENLYIYSENSGNGKAQPLSAKVLTETGYKDMSQIQLKEKVFGEDGNLHRVIGIFPQGEQDVYKVTFSDNTYTHCTKEHLWTVQTNSKGMHTITLEDMINNLNKSTDNNKSVFNYRIPLCQPINFAEKYLANDPYIMGLVVGNYINNKISKNTLNNVKSKEIIDNLIKKCETNDKIRLECRDKSKGNYNIYINDEQIMLYVKDFTDTERFNHLINLYLYNDIYVRYEFLKGIIDMSGKFRDKSNIIRIAHRNENVIKLVQQAVELLGGMCSIETHKDTIRQSNYIRKEQKPNNMLYIAYIDMPVAEYKLYCSSKYYEKIISKYEEYTPRKFITNIEYSHKEECQCIKLDSKSELYLTNNCIVTHNTSWAIKLMQEYFNQVWYGNRFRCRGLFVFVPEFLSLVRKNMYNPSKEFIDFEDRVKQADLVIWDDIGSSKLNESDSLQLLTYINKRELDLKANIYTSNVSHDKLNELVGNRLASRIWNKSIRVKLVGMDRRGLEDGDSSDTE